MILYPATPAITGNPLLENIANIFLWTTAGNHPRPRHMIMSSTFETYFLKLIIKVSKVFHVDQTQIENSQVLWSNGDIHIANKYE